MDDSQQTTTIREDEAKITLGLLNAVEANSQLTQRSAARELGIALGLANAYLKRCVRKGLIKVTQVPANRYAYYLTPKGFAEKSRLTAEYLTISFNFFRSARGQCGEVFDHCQARGWRRIVLAGAGDLGEIAVLCAAEAPVELLGFLDPDCAEERYVGLKVVDRLDALAPFDAVMITDFRNPQATFEGLAKMVPVERVVAPTLLRISRQPPTLVE